MGEIKKKNLWIGILPNTPYNRAVESHKNNKDFIVIFT